MKHLLLILISFLLLSSPVIGQETGVLYQYETSSGIQWKTFGDGKVQPKYKGEIKNGVMDGLGVLIYPYGGKSIVGEWKGGIEWNTKHKNKEGIIIGTFENGESKGITLYKRGRWSQNKWNRFGDKETHSVYQGQVKDWKPNGKGTFTSPNGKKYVGEYKDGEQHGQGTLIWSDGDKYVGDWKDGRQHGQGTSTRYNGRFRYEGGWKNGQKHGQGTTIYPTGSKHVGGWKDGLPNGHGKSTYSNGDFYEGEWKDGETWNGTGYDKNGKIQYKYVNGKYLKQ